jgi:probable F420-dependent oxidoreductase
MTAAASWTTTLRVGTRVACVDYHVPAVLAKEAATIDLLSDGRLVLGLGAGWHSEEYRSMGLTFDEAPRRVQKLEEVVALVKAHFSGQPVELDGQVVSVHDYVGVPERTPPPPIMIGGSRPRVLGLAGREADIVSLSNVIQPGVDTRAEIGRQLDRVRAGAGGRFEQLEFELMSVYVDVTDDDEKGLERAGRLLGAEPSFLRDHPLVLVGSVDRIAEQLVEQRENLGINYVCVPHHFVDVFAPVVAMLAGS